MGPPTPPPSGGYFDTARPVLRAEEKERAEADAKAKAEADEKAMVARYLTDSQSSFQEDHPVERGHVSGCCVFFGARHL